MTDALADELRRAIKNGLLHLSLSRKWDGTVWCVSYKNAENTSVQHREDLDPEKALIAAMRAGVRDTKPDRPRRRDVEDLA